ncbi:MAG: hypothetical protein ABI547_07690 [Betaproteobacteria bacterium]
MSPKLFGQIFNALLHLIAVGFAAASLYFFFGPTIELIMVALIMLGAAVAFEVIAAVVSEDRTAHT